MPRRGSTARPRHTPQPSVPALAGTSGHLPRSAPRTASIRTTGNGPDSRGGTGEQPDLPIDRIHPHHAAAATPISVSNTTITVARPCPSPVLRMTIQPQPARQTRPRARVRASDIGYAGRFIAWQAARGFLAWPMVVEDGGFGGLRVQRPSCRFRTRQRTLPAQAVPSQDAVHQECHQGQHGAGQRHPEQREQP